MCPSPYPTTLLHNVVAGESEAEGGRKRQRELHDTLHNELVSLSKRHPPDALTAGQGQDNFQKKGQDEEASEQQHSGGQQHSSLPHPVAGTSHLPALALKGKYESMQQETGVKQEDIQHQTPVKQESVKHEKMKQETGVNTGMRGVGCEETPVKACQKTAIKAEQLTLCGSALGQVERGSVSGQVAQAMAQCVKTWWPQCSK